MLSDDEIFTIPRLLSVTVVLLFLGIVMKAGLATALIFTSLILGVTVVTMIIYKYAG